MNSKKWEHFVQKMGAVAASKVVSAMTNGSYTIGPFVLIGSFLLFIAQVPFDPYQNLMTQLFGEQWNGVLFQISYSIFNVLAVGLALGVSYIFTRNENESAITAGMLSLVCFLILNDRIVFFESPFLSNPNNYMGYTGLSAGMFLGLGVGFIYSYFSKRKIKISLPEGVPPAVLSPLIPLIPIVIVLAICVTLAAVLQLMGLSYFKIIHECIQLPLQKLVSSYFGAVAIPVIISFIWWTGIHGATLISGLLGPFLLANALSNQHFIQQGISLVGNSNAYVLTAQFYDLFISISGSGVTLGLALLFLLSKNQHFKEIGKSSVEPGIFNINEPILFGTPIINNPKMLAPFILAPLASSLIAYTAIISGFITPFGAVIFPWTMPIILGAFMVGGVNAVIVQIVCFGVAFLVYLPFIK
ncbi:MAG: PTS sugar transporter subunit IIC [Brevinema sp.]